MDALVDLGVDGAGQVLAAAGDELEPRGGERAVDRRGRVMALAVQRPDGARRRRRARRCSRFASATAPASEPLSSRARASADSCDGVRTLVSVAKKPR